MAHLTSHRRFTLPLHIAYWQARPDTAPCTELMVSESRRHYGVEALRVPKVCNVLYLFGFDENAVWKCTFGPGRPGFAGAATVRSIFAMLVRPSRVTTRNISPPGGPDMPLEPSELGNGLRQREKPMRSDAIMTRSGACVSVRSCTDVRAPHP